MKSCLGCRFADWQRTRTGRLHPSGDGQCTFVVKVPALPLSMRWGGSWGRNDLDATGGAISRKHSFQSHCPCYQPTLS
jgi:hypothetical protein